jgi:serine/threonine protein kinase/tetratricopeptide (TPR) repeat protein
MLTLDPEQWQVLSPYIDEALGLTEEERARWLESLRAEKSEIAGQLESLLEEHRIAEQEGFLTTVSLVNLLPARASLAGKTIGAYKLISPIGHGGMGTVWLAERIDGRFERRCAFKFLNVAMVGQGEARFKREGAIVGRLSHPNIARLLDAGVAEGGQPYLVLEHIDGEPIDRYCDSRKLDVRARVRLFLDVLGAVGHAHANLIVHRDIKPSNVLVSKDGQVKLLDFGIAKLLEGNGTGGKATQLTIEAGRAMTPEFAAPEQVTDAPVTTGTDVYALGVLLYVLLTGRHPAGSTRSPAELLKAIVETEPARLSTVITAARENAGVVETIASRRDSTPEKLARQLGGDLETIVSKALKKNPQERYGSVTAFAEDLSRYLRQEPISARPDSLAYRASKFVQRNRVAVVLGLLSLIAVSAGVAGTLIQARTARRQRDAALRERDRASRVTEFMTGIFKVSDPSETTGNGVTARAILDKAANEIDSGLTKDPELRVEMMHAMGSVYGNLGLYPKAQALMEKAIEVGTAANGPRDPETLRTMSDLGFIYLQQGRVADAETMLRETLQNQAALFGREHLDTLFTMSNLSFALEEGGKLDEATRLARELYETELRIYGLEDRHTLTAMDSLAVMLGINGQLAESEQLERQAIEAEKRVRGPDNLGVLNSMGNLGDTLYVMGKYTEAEKTWRETLAIQNRVLGPSHPETARSVYNLGCTAALASRKDEALALLNSAIDNLSPRTVPSMDDDPAFEGLRADPRFRRLATRANQRGGKGAKCPL